MKALRSRQVGAVALILNMGVVFYRSYALQSRFYWLRSGAGELEGCEMETLSLQLCKFYSIESSQSRKIRQKLQ